MKKRKLIIKLLLVSSLIALPLSAQNGIEYYYADMPDIMDPTMSRKQRVELLEYYKADMGDSIANRFGNQTHLLVLDTLNNHIRVQNTEISTLEMSLFENGTDTIIGLIKTICSPVCTSIVEFYNTDWVKLTDLAFTMPKAWDWVIKEKLADVNEVQNILNALNLSFVSLSFDTQSNEIIATNHSLEFLDDAGKERVLPFVSDDEFRYKLVDKKWERI